MSDAKISPSLVRALFGAQLCQRPFSGSLRTPKYAPTSQSALNCKKAAQKSGFPFACARLLLFPTKRARFDPTENSFDGNPTLRRFAGTPIEALFRASHLNESVRAFEAFSRSASKYHAQLISILAGVLGSDVSFSKTDLRAAQPNLHRGRIFAHACKSRRAK